MRRPTAACDVIYNHVVFCRLIELEEKIGNKQTLFRASDVPRWWIFVGDVDASCRKPSRNACLRRAHTAQLRVGRSNTEWTISDLEMCNVKQVRTTKVATTVYRDTLRNCHISRFKIELCITVFVFVHHFSGPGHASNQLCVCRR